jgi:hypothetical protein
MAHTRKQEERLLDKDERDMVAQSHMPALAGLDDKDLAALLPRVRESRDKARAVAQRQRREMRGKAAARGAEPARDDAGSQGKRDVLGKAVRRVAKEIERRRAKSARNATADGAARALDMKNSSKKPSRPSSRRADKGMKDVPSGKTPRNTSIAEDGSDIALHRSRTAR